MNVNIESKSESKSEQALFFNFENINDNDNISNLSNLPTKPSTNNVNFCDLKKNFKKSDKITGIKLMCRKDIKEPSEIHTQNQNTIKQISGVNKINLEKLTKFNNDPNVIRANILTQNINVIWNGFNRFSPQTNLLVKRNNSENEIKVYNYQTQEQIMTISTFDLYLLVIQTNRDPFNIIRELIESANNFEDAICNLI